QPNRTEWTKLATTTTAPIAPTRPTRLTERISASSPVSPAGPPSSLADIPYRRGAQCNNHPVATRRLEYPERRLATPARVLELAYRGALKALAPMGHVGSNPTPGTCVRLARECQTPAAASASAGSG